MKYVKRTWFLMTVGPFIIVDALDSLLSAILEITGGAYDDGNWLWWREGKKEYPDDYSDYV